MVNPSTYIDQLSTIHGCTLLATVNHSLFIRVPKIYIEGVIESR